LKERASALALSLTGTRPFVGCDYSKNFVSKEAFEDTKGRFIQRD